MVGSMALLGHWDPARAIELNTTEAAFPVWSIKIDLPRDKIIEYKYLIIKGPKKGQPLSSALKQPIEWENLPAGINRLVDTHGKKEITIYDKMDDLEQTEEYVEVQNDKKRFGSDVDHGDFPAGTHHHFKEDNEN
jgi:hypothetical protein